MTDILVELQSLFQCNLAEPSVGVRQPYQRAPSLTWIRASALRLLTYACLMRCTFAISRITATLVTQSPRWLRFPCCGQRFACDICHEEAVPDGHEAAWATRMVCGYCSREQRVDKACKYCGKKLATSAAQPSGRNTRFWEGGKGCRWVKSLQLCEYGWVDSLQVCGVFIASRDTGVASQIVGRSGHV
eukprot:GHUV01047980.1.p1 GENE.GHUV01047980.1~~GHUV01047980.1.p1  ORF type:complete len:188 (-),score=10.35 GHUV01047980.1:32-595(-)